MPVQSALLPHWTQAFFTHTGVEVPAQSSLVVHCTHCCDPGSQMLSEVGQSLEPTQPTQAPLLRSQIGLLLSCEHCWLL
jgi:hypothetical protein